MFKRSVSKSFGEHYISIFLKKLLLERSRRLVSERGSPFVVFANDLIGVNINVDGVYESENLHDLKNVIAELGIDAASSTAIDIGANIGNHSLYFSKFFRKVVCFEPNPRTFEVLRVNLSQVSNVELFNFGCGRFSEKLTLTEDFVNIGSSSAVRNGLDDFSFKIDVRPLDEFVSSFENIALLKIDVEGMEFPALVGAEKVITLHKPLICFEQHEEEFTSNFRETETIDWLRSKGYRIFAFQRRFGRNKLSRFFMLVKHMFFGVNQIREVVEFDILPKSNYSMVYAVHHSKLI